jgi:pantoate--beta-alanine ligase
VILRTVADLRKLARGWRAAGETIGVVPTMGALHDGHLSLARRARAECDRVITTIFVNPKQFNNPEDLKKYPRSEAADAALLATVPVDAIFAPPVEEVYPEGFITNVTMQGVAQPLEGYMRPGHFDGVATVVTKLFGMSLADRGYFGQKDWQQLQVVLRLVRDLNVPVEVVGCETIREADGLAMSSRNVRLTLGQGAGAVCGDHAGGDRHSRRSRRPHGDPRGGRDDARGGVRAGGVHRAARCRDADALGRSPSPAPDAGCRLGRRCAADRQHSGVTARSRPEQGSKAGVCPRLATISAGCKRPVGVQISPWSRTPSVPNRLECRPNSRRSPSHWPEQSPPWSVPSPQHWAGLCLLLQANSTL